MDLILDIATWVLLLAGSILLIITGFGLLRLPDLYTRIHAGGMADTLATFLIFVGLSLQSGLSLVSVKLLLVIVFIFFTSPTASYALAQAGFVAGLKPKLDGFGAREQPKEDA
ncbi:monovalent cation/H(+) antiporter subunit G [Sneathiella sp.]|uniref:monovalent cation/H(+) antiporter subunit G n=1 Tax=Sneathiella sp. TaxID=1964365 RepID=UPI0026082F0B|nr:monovalent cation/H(+) antiporter subunit G [Sneathiella sp.]MDF2368384.1 monovalent cation/H(+) antiporter subunit G [Sneathiella sp.]